MKLLEIIQESVELAWWIEIVTEEPRCSYYFGPFASTKEAALAQLGYIEDLAQEGTQGITAQIKWCKPWNLTSCEEEFAHLSMEYFNP